MHELKTKDVHCRGPFNQNLGPFVAALMFTGIITVPSISYGLGLFFEFCIYKVGSLKHLLTGKYSHLSVCDPNLPEVVAETSYLFINKRRK